MQLNYTSQFEVTTVNNIFQAKYVVLATGVTRNVPNIKRNKKNLKEKVLVIVQYVMHFFIETKT